MRTCLLVALAVFFSNSDAYAGIVFRTEASQPQVRQGSPVNFDVYIASDSGPVDVNYIEVRALAGDLSGSAGLFTAASQVFLLLGGGDESFDLTGDPGFPGSAYSINSGPTLSLDGEVRYAQLVLDTSAAQLGTYDFSLDSLFAFNFVGAGGTEVPTSAASPVAYTITAIPEPTALGTVGLIMLVAGVRRRRCCL